MDPCYCDDNCRSGWETDREYGVIYPQMAVPPELMHLFPPDTHFVQHNSGLRSVAWTTGCDVLRICRYCKKAVEDVQAEADHG